MGHRLAPQAEADLDETWYYVATSSGSPDVADRIIDSLVSRFFLLSTQPHMGRSRAEDLRPGIRTFPVGEYVIAYRLEEDDVLILRVFRGSRDIDGLFRE